MSNLFVIVVGGLVGLKVISDLIFWIAYKVGWL